MLTTTPLGMLSLVVDAWCDWQRRADRDWHCATSQRDIEQTLCDLKLKRTVRSCHSAASAPDAGASVTSARLIIVNGTTATATGSGALSEAKPSPHEPIETAHFNLTQHRDPFQ